MKHVSEHFIRSDDFRPKIEEVKYTRITFTLPEHLVCFGDEFEELAHRKVPYEEQHLLGLMLRIARHNGYRVKKLLLEELFRGMNEWGLFDDEDAEELRQFVDEGIREYHIHGPFDAKSYEMHRAEYLASKAGSSEPSLAEKAA